jgi:hypothetical protein
MRLAFDTCNIYSQLYVADARLATTLSYLNEEEAIHFEQGFSVRRNSVAVATTTPNDRYHVEVSDEPLSPDMLERAVFAIRLPCEFDSGFVFITGRMARMDPEDLALATVGGSVVQLNPSGQLEGIFPVQGVTGITVVEYPGSKVLIHFSKGPRLDARLLVAYERFSRQRDFALAVVPLRVREDALNQY